MKDYHHRSGGTLQPRKLNETRTNPHLIEEIKSLRQQIAALEGTPIEQTPVELATAIMKAAPDTPKIMLPGFGEMMIGAGEGPAGVDCLSRQARYFGGL